jgi:hypothetical protein
MDTLTKLEMNLEDVKREILSLSTMDYCSDPRKDPKIKGCADIWENYS